MEWSSTALRMLRAISERGSFSAAATALGYTQSAVSRQMAVLERTAGARLFERRAGGVRLTAAGTTLLRHASAALDEVDHAEHLLRGGNSNGATVRLGIFTSVSAALVPEALALMRQHRPDVEVITREGSTPSLTRSLRAAALDLAVISSRAPYPPPDDEDPPLELDILAEGDLLVAVPTHGDLGRDGTVTLAELQDATWISSPQTPGEPGLGVWPALSRRPPIRHHTRDWLVKLSLVAAGWGITTLPPYLVGIVPASVRLVSVSDGPPVSGRVLLARVPKQTTEAVAEFASCLHEVADSLVLS